MTTDTLSARTGDRVSRVVNWALGALAGLIVLLVVGLGIAVAGSSVYYEMNRTKAGDINRTIEMELPAAATTDQVIAFLDSKGIEHGPLEPASASHIDLLETGVPLGTPIISAIIRNDGYGIDLGKIQMSLLLDLADVQMYFTFDEAGMVRQRMITDDHHRPTLLDLNAGD